jgi:DNA polymerase gamma 1
LDSDLSDLPDYPPFETHEHFLKWIDGKPEALQKLFISRKGDWKHPLVPGTSSKKFSHRDRVLLAFAEGWRPKSADAFTKSDPWISQFNWNFPISGKDAFVPDWWKKCQRLTTKNIMTHLLLNLEWNNRPLFYSRTNGWGTWIEDGKFEKVPHPDGGNANVGGVLGKNFVEAMEHGVLSSKNSASKRVMEIAYSVSYWTSVQSRVQEIIYKEIPGENHNLFVPDIICHGTLTRRCSGSLLPTLTSTKRKKIATELKSRIEAPRGYKMLYLDFDAQEMAIAALYADKWEGGIVGASAFGHTAFNGDKASGTDAHTKLASSIFYEPRGIRFENGDWTIEE